MAETDPSPVPDHALTVRDKLLLARRMFRLITADTVGLVGDALTPVDMSVHGPQSADIFDRAEHRTEAIEVNLNRFKLNEKIGSMEYRQGIERAFIEEFQPER